MAMVLADNQKNCNNDYRQTSDTPIARVCNQHYESISFASSGLHFYYMLGVADTLLEHKISFQKCYGSSGGVAVAIYYLLDLRETLSFDTILDTLPTGKRRKAPLFHAWMRSPGETHAKGIELARTRLMRMMKYVLKTHPEAYKHLSGRLFIYVTAFPWACSRYISQWRSNEELYQSILATTCIPGVDTGFAPVNVGGKWFVDGGFSVAQPILDSRTVCVTTKKFDCKSKAYRLKGQWWGEISRRVIKGSLNVEKKKFYVRLYQWGREDCLEYLADIF